MSYLSVTNEKKKEIEEKLTKILTSIKMINPKDVIITGGCIESLIHNEIPNDYDIYFTNYDDLMSIYNTMENAIKNAKFGSGAPTVRNGLQFVEPHSAFTERGILFTHCLLSFEKDGNKIQLVTRTSGSVEHIHEEFDFLHCTHYFTLKTGLCLNEKALNNDRVLIFNENCHMTPDLIIRLDKFIRRGYSISKETLIKIFNTINSRPKDNDTFY